MKFSVTDHAVTRYVDRVKPTFDHAAARTELERLVGMAGPIQGKPDWLHLPAYCPDAAKDYLSLSDGIVAAVKQNLVTTVITRGGSSPRHAEQKAERKKRAKRKRPIRNLRGRREEPKRIWR